MNIKLLQRVKLALIVLLIVCAGQVYAQQVHNDHHHAVKIGFDKLSEDLERGVITRQDALIEQLRLTLDPASASQQYLDDSGFIRCLTPVITEYHSHRESYDLDVVLAMDDLLFSTRNHSESYISPSGKFVLYYSVDGQHAVPLDDADFNGIPDYIERAAAYADSSWNYMVNGLGFPEFVNPDRMYSIYFEDIRSYGYTMPSGNQSTSIVVHSTFDGFPENRDPEGHRLGSLKVTIAHEIKHALQYTVNQWRGVSGYLNWLEMDATMMENVVFSDVKDYHNYLGPQSVFRAPERSTPLAYAHATWMLFYAEHLGIDFWVDTWARVGTSSGDMLAAINEELQSRSLTFGEVNTRNLLWHLASGSYAPAGYGFNDKHEYPTPTLVQTFSDAKFVTYGHDRSLNKLSANFFMIEPPSGENGIAHIRVLSQGGNPGAGVLAYLKNGDVAEYLAVDNGSGSLLVQTGRSWNEIEKIGIAVVNSSQNDGMDYTVEVETIELPLAAELDQNYPNPFNPSTTIRFTMPSAGNASLVIYDVLGRRVATLFSNREFSAGTQLAEFNASDLASGVYLYRLVTDSGIQTRKMTLLK
ncbi:MAG: T9SS C-terminal target domain-containing protein [Balneolaceae bacterium]|nr:MAG: T9SS C-terminal target domain-containing protein [Balneolaceae bacterium]